MENGDNPDALVDSFFLPGGILDPESYEEEKEKAALNSSFPQESSQSSPQKQLLPTTTAAFTSFPPAINPNNPWAQTGTPKSSGPVPPLEVDQSSSFFQSGAPFQLQPTPLAPVISSPPRIAVSSSRPPPGFQAPPGFENVPKETSFTDDESIQSVPRELLPDKSSYAGSSTSSLSGSSVDEGEDDDDDDDDDEEDNNEEQDEDVVEETTRGNTEDQALEDDEAVNQEEDNDVTVELEEFFEEDVEVLDENQVDRSNKWKDEQEDCPQTPESNTKAVRIIVGENEQAANISSPVVTRDVHEKDTPISSPSQLKPKQRKRRGTRKSKTQQSPIKEKEIATSSKVEPLPVLEKKPAAAKPKEKVAKAPQQQHDLWKESRIVIDALTRDLTIFASFSVVLYRAALDEALGDTVALGSYLFFRYCPMIIGRFIVEVSLPHWTSHLVTMIGVWQICTPAKNDETVVPLNMLRVAAVVGFVVDGFSQEHAAIMMIPGTMRMLLVFLLLMIRGGYWDSTLLWFSLMVQILLAFAIPFDQILIMIGLASLNYKRNLALKTAVLKAPKA